MRWLTPSLVALALVFSTGGVAIVGRADPASDAKAERAQSVAPEAKSIPAAEPPSQCPAPTVVRRPASAGPQEVRRAGPNKSIVLNTNGYNYPLEGEWHPDPVASPQGVPDGVLPTDREAAPAAPEPK